jgi:hypothetical protein
MILRRVLISVLLGCLLALAALTVAWFVNENAAWALVPGARLIEAFNQSLRLPVWLNQLLLVLLNGILWGGVFLVIWLGVVRRRPREGAAFYDAPAVKPSDRS